jgi:hypothetical protein
MASNYFLRHVLAPHMASHCCKAQRSAEQGAAGSVVRRRSTPSGHRQHATAAAGTVYWYFWWYYWCWLAGTSTVRYRCTDTICSLLLSSETLLLGL